MRFMKSKSTRLNHFYFNFIPTLFLFLIKSTFLFKFLLDKINYYFNKEKGCLLSLKSLY